MKTGTDPISSARDIFRQYKSLAEKAMLQITDEEFFFTPEPESNSIALIVKHLSGNMKSRWTDFLTSDGEKEWRKRDDEFENPGNRKELMQAWEDGWNCLFHALDPLDYEDISRIITIRSEEHSVLEAINRQIAHYSYHVGQIVYLAKSMKGNAWQTLSIAKGKSADFNQKMKHE
jgi:hypothetical protein